ncbi:MAG: adenylate/guanylate cyclase domain-containing protein [Thermodesulfobacteriota bacterium]
MAPREKNIAGINFAPIFAYLEQLGRDPAPIFERTGLGREELIDRREYVDLPASRIIFSTVKEIIGDNDPMIFYDIGRESARTRSLDLLHDIGASLGNVEETVRFIPRFNRKFNNVFDMVVCGVSDHSAVVLIYYKNKYDNLWFYDQCPWNKGNIAAIPTVWGLPYMDIEEPLCRFSLNEIFRDYAYLKHPYHCENGKAFLGGEPFAVKVHLGREKLNRSVDRLSRMSPLNRKDAAITVLTNQNYEMPGGSAGPGDIAGGMLITKDTVVSNRLTLKKGQVFGAPYCRLNIRWQRKKQLLGTLLDKTVGTYRNSGRLLGHLEKELEANILQKQELIKSREELQIAHNRLKDYTERLEHMVLERTRELETEKEKVLNAQKLLSRYLAPQLAKKILDGQIEIVWGHQRKKLTMFFSDIKDFTQTTDSMEPEDMAGLLNEYLAHMIEIVHKYEGTLAHIIGDALFVFFGAPEHNTDKQHALQCVFMAVDMQRQMKALQNKWFSEGVEDPLQIRCGINTGMATVGGYGSKDRREYTAMGTQVNLASRLESACEPGGILISHSTWALVKSKIGCEPMDQITMKGFRRPVRTYRVIFE